MASARGIATAENSSRAEVSRRRLLVDLGRAAAGLPLTLLPWSVAATLADDAHLTERLDEVFQIVRDKIAMPGGHLAMFCSRDFTPVDERSSFGHELETAYLLLEATELLDRDDNPRR